MVSLVFTGQHDDPLGALGGTVERDGLQREVGKGNALAVDHAPVAVLTAQRGAITRLFLGAGQGPDLEGFGLHPGLGPLADGDGVNEPVRFPVALEIFLTASRSACFHDTALSQLFIPLTS